MPHPHTLPHILTPPCSLHAQEHDTRQKLKAAEKLANSRTIAAREAEHTLRTTSRQKREAEVRLAACEDELAALKVEHDDLRRRAKLAQYMRAAPGMRTKASVQVELPLPRPVGKLRTTFCDADMRLSRGGRGGIFVLRRIRT